VPRNQWIGYLTIVAGLLLIAGSGWYLATGEQGRSTLGVVLDVVICVVAVVMIVQAIFGLAALRRGHGDGP
jgi:hypothetical protein